MFVFPFGIPISAFVILYRNREKILAGDKATLKQFDMLIDDYNLDCYYWEIVELVRKLLWRASSCSSDVARHCKALAVSASRLCSSHGRSNPSHSS